MTWDIRQLSEVERRSIDWLWYPYLARKEVTMVEGDPAAGKSWIIQVVGKYACDGELRKLPSPDSSRSYKGFVKVLAFDADNSIDTITKARLEWADCEHPENYFQKEEAFSIKTNYQKVAKAIESTGAEIVIFDIVTYYIRGDSSKPDIATELQCFKKLAREHNCAVILCRWLTKARGDGRAIQAGQGNMAFTGVVSIEMVISRMPGEEDNLKNRRRVFGVSKCRVGVEASPHDFYIKTSPTLKDPDRAVTEFGQYLDNITADDLTKSPKDGGRPDDVREVAKEFLRETLRDGPVEGRRVERMASARNVSLSTLRRACDEVGVDKSKAAGQKGVSKWSLRAKLSLVAQNS
jgi:AAA domain